MGLLSFDPYKGILGDPVANMPAAPNMVMAPPPSGPLNPNIMQRLMSRFMPAEQVPGLLGADDIKNARQQGLLGLGAGLLANAGPKTADQRVGAMQSLSQGLQQGQQAFQGALQAPMAQRMAMQQYGQDTTLKQQQIDANAAAQAKAAQMAQVRQAVVKQYGQPDGSPTGTAAWIDKVLPDLMAAGDDEMVGRLSEIRKSLGAAGQKQWVRNELGDRVEWLDPITHQVMKVDKVGISPRDVASGAATRLSLQQQRDAARSNHLAQQYNTATKKFAETADSYNTVLASASDPSAAGDLSLIFAYMKMLDPGSVVREGEFATAATAGSIPERIWAQYNKGLKGERLSQAMRDDFVARARKVATARRAQLGRYIDQYSRRAKGQQLDPQDVAFDYFTGMPLDQASEFSDVGGGSATTAPGSSVGSLQQKYGSLK